MNALSRRLTTLCEGIPRVFWTLWAGTLVNRAGTFVMPLLFVYLTQVRGLPLPVAGTVVSLHGFGALFGGLSGGALADRIGRRAVMLFSLLTGAVFMLALAAARAVPHVAATTLLLGFFTEMYRPAVNALVADVVPTAHRMKAFGLQYWATNLGFSFAAIVGGYMAKRNFATLFVVDAATTLVLAIIVWRSVPESRPAEARIDPPGHLFTPFLDPRYLPFLVLNFAVALVFFQHLSALPEDMRQKGLTTEHFGLAVATNCVMIVLFQPAVTKWVASVPRAALLAIASALTGLGFGATTLATTLPSYVATVAVWTLAEIVFAPVNASIVAELSPTHLRGRYQGAFGITWSFAAMGAPALSSRIIPATSPRTFWLLCLGAGLATAFLHAVFTARYLPRAPKA
jgi:MFS family permease